MCFTRSLKITKFCIFLYIFCKVLYIFCIFLYNFVYFCIFLVFFVYLCIFVYFSKISSIFVHLGIFFRSDRSNRLSPCGSFCRDVAGPCVRLFKRPPTKVYDEELSWHRGHGSTCTRDVTLRSTSGTSDDTFPPSDASGNSTRKKKRRRGAPTISRPASLLVSENGFVRVRQEGELGGDPVMLSTDDELDEIR